MGMISTGVNRLPATNDFWGQTLTGGYISRLVDDEDKESVAFIGRCILSPLVLPIFAALDILSIPIKAIERVVEIVSPPPTKGQVSPQENWVMSDKSKPVEESNSERSEQTLQAVSKIFSDKIPSYADVENVSTPSEPSPSPQAMQLIRDQFFKNIEADPFGCIVNVRLSLRIYRKESRDDSALFSTNDFNKFKEMQPKILETLEKKHPEDAEMILLGITSLFDNLPGQKF